jgi:hypothetical protein
MESQYEVTYDTVITVEKTETSVATVVMIVNVSTMVVWAVDDQKVTTV